MRYMVMTCLLLFAANIWAQDGKRAAGAAEFEVGMLLDIAADGSVAHVEPDPDLPAPIRAALVKRVAQWHYSVPMWQGHAVSTRARQGLRLQAVPTTAGGYALRVLGEAFPPDPDPAYAKSPPDYPKPLMRRKVGGSFVYVLHIDATGQVASLRRAFPEGTLDSDMQQLDEAAQDASIKWPFRPHIADGAAVDCDVVSPMVFIPAGGDDSKTGKLDLKPYQAGLALCPNAKLETKIAGTLL